MTRMATHIRPEDRNDRRVLFTWRGIQVHSYPAMLYVGTVLGIVASNIAANLAGMDSARVYIALLLLVIPAMVGSRLLFVATHWHIYRHEPNRIWRRSEGGGALQGGFLLSLAVSVPLLSILNVPFAEFWDVATFTMLIGLIFTRVGCTLNGCCIGRPSDGPLALCLPDHRGVWQRRIPTQFLEAGLAAMLLLGAVGLWSHRPFPGAIALLMLAGYAIGRIILQPMRADQDQVGRINVQGAISATIAVVALVGFLTGMLSIR